MSQGVLVKHFFEGVPVGFFEVVNEALCFGHLWNIKIQNNHVYLGSQGLKFVHLANKTSGIKVQTRD